MLYKLCLRWYRRDRKEWYEWRKKRWSQTFIIPPKTERLNKLVFKHALYWRSWWQIYYDRGF